MSATNTQNPVLSVKNVVALTGIGRKMLSKWALEGDFPKPKNIRGRNYWRKNAIDNWLASFGEVSDED